jgi:hypothetical protein
MYTYDKKVMQRKVRAASLSQSEFANSVMDDNRSKSIKQKKNTVAPQDANKTPIQGKFSDYLWEAGKAAAMVGGGALVACALPIASLTAGTGALIGGGLYAAKKIYNYAKKPSYRFGDNVDTHYRQYDESQTTNKFIGSRSGLKVPIRHNRGSAYVKAPGYGDKYTEMISGLKEGDNLHDKELASDLLSNTNTHLKSDKQKMNAALMETVVGLAEEWRKRGASWIFRGILRGIKAGKWTLSEIPKLFKFVESADGGRKMVGRFQDVKEGRTKVTALDADEQDIYGYVSEREDDAYESDKEVRKKHAMKGQRLFSKKHL